MKKPESILEARDDREGLFQGGIDYCYKEMLREFLGMHNMRNVGGIEPEWAISNKQYQALQSELEGIKKC